MCDCIRCGKPAIMKIDMRPQFHSILYYCEEHIPVGFNGIVPEYARLAEYRAGLRDAAPVPMYERGDLP